MRMEEREMMESQAVDGYGRLRNDWLENSLFKICTSDKTPDRKLAFFEP